MYFPLSVSLLNVVLAYVTNVLLASQVVLVDQAVIVKVPSLVLAVTVLLRAGDPFGLVTVIVGAVVSKTIVSVVSDVVFPKESLNLIYTVFVASHALNVHAILELHDVRLVGAALLPYATWTHHTSPSTAQVVFNVTDCDVVYDASLLIVKLQPAGAVLSTVKYASEISPRPPPALATLTLYCVESPPAVAVFQEYDAAPLTL